MTKPNGPDSPPTDDETRRRLGRMTRRGLAIGGAAILAGVAGRHWIYRTGEEGMLAWPLRRVLGFDERIGRAAFGPSRPTPTFPLARARMPRVNGSYGLDPAPDLDKFRLRVEGPGGARPFTLAEIKALPRVEMITELRCIEGWSTIVRWAGARLSDLADAARLATRSGLPAGPRGKPDDLLAYASLATPDGRYYVGLDAASARHPQTLLCYEMDGRPLTPGHGAPLRLTIPVKYGIKSIKNLGSIRFTDARPADFWADRGYDWYAGH